VSVRHRWLDRVPLDARSRRAVVETLSDWPAGRPVENMVSLSRVLGRIAVREIGEFAEPLLVMRVIWMCAIMAGIAVLPRWFAGVESSWRGVVENLSSVAGLVVPIAVYVAALGEAPRRPRAIALTAIAGTLLAPTSIALALAHRSTLALNGWLFMLAWATVLILIADRVILLGYHFRTALIAFVGPALLAMATLTATQPLLANLGSLGGYVPGTLFLSTYTALWWLLVRRFERRGVAA